EPCLLHALDVRLRDAMIPSSDELLECGSTVSFGLHRLDVVGRDAVVPRANEGVERGCSEAERLDATDVLDIDTVALRALNLVERELVESFGLQLADVSGPDVVDGELIAAPEWQIVRVPQRLDLADKSVYPSDLISPTYASRGAN